MALKVLQPGILSLLQDSGRVGQHRLGLTTGGPLDPEAYRLCNRILSNAPASTAIEVSFGGLQLECHTATFVCLTGAPMGLQINGKERPQWQVLAVAAGDIISLGYAERGCRAYLGVAKGFSIAPSFGSTATVMREGIGGLNGDKLQAGDVLPCKTVNDLVRLYLPKEFQPRYENAIRLRVIPGYQVKHFNRLQQRRFFSHTYTVSNRCDRMGYRLEGPAISCDIEGILSEGICFGAIQIPADGQPIILLNDRQTIGGYPKIGAALSLDVARLSQMRTKDTIEFTPISSYEAHNALQLAHSLQTRQVLEERSR